MFVWDCGRFQCPLHFLVEISIFVILHICMSERGVVLIREWRLKFVVNTILLFCNFGYVEKRERGHMGVVSSVLTPAD
jgi:hypothetical protein